VRDGGSYGEVCMGCGEGGGVVGIGAGVAASWSLRWGLGGVVGLSNCAGLLFVCSLSFAWVVLFMLPMFQFVACWCLCTDRD
jgi:hypothetical protein